MKRGWITWDRTEFPPAAFEARLERVRKTLAERDLPALVVYTDVWKSNRARYFSNFMPYWNRALLVIPTNDKPVLLCSLSPRVYPWIKSVTILEEIKPSPNLAQRVFEMCSEKDWKKIGVLDLMGLPYDLYAQLREGKVELEDVPWSAVRQPQPDQWELAMYHHTAKITREILGEELPGGAGLVDYELVGRLERGFRRAGAEDLVILVTNGETPPAPPTGATLGEDFSVSVALEYRGHWVKLARTRSGAKIPEFFAKGVTEAGEDRFENLSGPYPYEPCQPPPEPGSLWAATIERVGNGRRLFYADTCWQGEGGAELL
jgi:Xaa-Pro aminopeptidase